MDSAEVARVAYELFERDGRVDGRDREHWFEAERIVRERAGAAEKTKAPRRKVKTSEAPKAKPAAPRARPGTHKNRAR